MPQTRAQETLVVGLGKTGLSCARHLKRIGVEFVVTDSRLQPPGIDELKNELPEVNVVLGGFCDQDFARAKQIILSPGIAMKEQHVFTAKQHGTEVLGDIELFARATKVPTIAITGTNGKSTVTSLVAAMAKQAGKRVQCGGNIGKPALDLLESKDTELFVLELSSFQLETTQSLNAVAAVVLNISEDHMDRYDSLNDYAIVKQSVYRGDGVMIINRNDAHVNKMRDATRNTTSFGLDEPQAGDFGLRQQNGKDYLAQGERCLLAIDELKIVGNHNISNALAALALGSAAGLDESSMFSVLKAFTGLSHRSQWVADKDNIRWFNDSKATNVGATIAALEGMPGKLILIAGGEGKGADFSALKQVLCQHVEAVVLIGRDASLIEAALDGCVPVHHALTMYEAVKSAAQIAKPDTSILLSPACASFDMYKNFEERGDDFIAQVNEVLQ